ncbi:uncharacterized protein LOC141904123 [Tubulanus polymorphus]|uniref:uncharacterized protein LOC141904123 n=1 Tax=Tubulanus polymorphus TaxID=672921 RepID=UPI003DA4E2F2
MENYRQQILTVAIICFFSCILLTEGHSFSSVKRNVAVFQMQKDINPEMDAKLQVNAKCYLCKYFVDKLATFLEKNEAVVNKTIDGLCEAILRNRLICSFVDSALTNFIDQLIRGQLSPTSACVKVKFCAGNSRLKTKQDGVVHQIRSVDKARCDICQYSIRDIQDSVIENSADVERFLIEQCSPLESPNDRYCKSLIHDAFASGISSYFESSLSPHSVCKIIGSCLD